MYEYFLNHDGRPNNMNNSMKLVSTHHYFKTSFCINLFESGSKQGHTLLWGKYSLKNELCLFLPRIYLFMSLTCFVNMVLWEVHVLDLSVCFLWCHLTFPPSPIFFRIFRKLAFMVWFYLGSGGGGAGRGSFIDSVMCLPFVSYPEIIFSSLVMLTKQWVQRVAAWSLHCQVPNQPFTFWFHSLISA